MRILNFALAAALSAIGNTAPTISQFQPRQATTASERLGLTWLGGNSSLPKVLYASPKNLTRTYPPNYPQRPLHGWHHSRRLHLRRPRRHAIRATQPNSRRHNRVQPVPPQQHTTRRLKLDFRRWLNRHKRRPSHEHDTLRPRRPLLPRQRYRRRGLHARHEFARRNSLSDGLAC